VRNAPLFIVIALLLVAALTRGAGAADTLPVLRRHLLEAQDPEHTATALHALAQHVGEPAFFKDHGAFADWLGTLPDGRAEDLLVRRHRGWALVRAKRGGEAIVHLEAALKDGPSNGLTRAWLADALRQGGRFMEAAKMLAAAVRCGQQGTYVNDTIASILFASRAANLSGHADDLPEYVLAANAYLTARPDPRIHALTARFLLDDYATFEKPDRTRGKHWAREAAMHALASLTSLKEAAAPPLAGSETLAYDAAKALAWLDRETHGKTLRFDLLAQAYSLAADPQGGANRRPDVVVWLAEGAAQDGRFELAHRLVQERLAISDSPRAQRLLLKLPPDLGDDD